MKTIIAGVSVWQMRELSTQSGREGQNSLRAAFGLGNATEITLARIKWPSGTVQTEMNLAGNRIVGIYEAQAIPVELVSFAGVVDGSDVASRWETASETNNAGFEVQWKPGAYEQPWRVLDFVEGGGTTTAPQQYRYRVKDLEAGPHHFRLRQVDFDGTVAYSPEVELTLEPETSYLLSSAYPNPFNSKTHLMLTLHTQQQVRIEAFNVQGVQVALLHEGVLSAPQSHRFSFDATNLPSGVYVLRVVGERIRTHQNPSDSDLDETGVGGACKSNGREM